MVSTHRLVGELRHRQGATSQALTVGNSRIRTQVRFPGSPSLYPVSVVPVAPIPLGLRGPFSGTAHCATSDINPGPICSGAIKACRHHDLMCDMLSVSLGIFMELVPGPQSLWVLKSLIQNGVIFAYNLYIL